MHINLLRNYTQIFHFVEKSSDDVIITSDKSNYMAATTLLTVTIDHTHPFNQGTFPSAAVLMWGAFKNLIKATEASYWLPGYISEIQANV